MKFLASKIIFISVISYIAIIVGYLLLSSPQYKLMDNINCFLSCLNTLFQKKPTHRKKILKFINKILVPNTEKQIPRQRVKNINCDLSYLRADILLIFIDLICAVQESKQQRYFLHCTVRPRECSQASSQIVNQSQRQKLALVPLPNKLCFSEN